MKKFEYFQYKSKNTISISELNQYGLSGWELVHVAQEENYPDFFYIYYSKKEIIV